MKKILLTFACIVSAILFVMTTGCKKSSSSPIEVVENETTNYIVVRKPNIYLYPQAKNVISVKLEFPLGGRVIESIPFYSDEWFVEVEPDGRIENKYDYLFYECKTPDDYQYQFGWIVERDSLLKFFNVNLLNIGFNGSEIKDFIDYWIPRLKDSPFYIIYPQFSDEINKVIKLNISKTPDSILRLFYVIKGSTDGAGEMLTPTIPVFKREGFVVTEWGVVIK